MKNEENMLALVPVTGVLTVGAKLNVAMDLPESSVSEKFYKAHQLGLFRTELSQVIKKLL